METSPSPTVQQAAGQPPIVLTARALEAIKQAFAAQNLQGHSLRVGLIPGGCAGFSYDLDVVAEVRPGDLRFEQEGVAITMDPKAVPFLQGTEIDYVQDGLRAGFAFKNPNARSSCGCGSSFQA